jgi:tellurite resistance protein TehA-like permease
VVENLYSQVVKAGFLGADMKVLLLGFLIVLVCLFYESEVFERLAGSKIRGHLHLAYATFGLPLMILLMEWQRSRRGGGVFRVLGLFALVLLVIFIGILALIAFLIYRYLRRRR